MVWRRISKKTLPEPILTKSHDAKQSQLAKKQSADQDQVTVENFEWNRPFTQYSINLGNICSLFY